VSVCVRAVGSFLEIFGYDRCRAVARGGCVWRTRSGRTASCRAAAATAAALIRTPGVVGRLVYFFSFASSGYLVEQKDSACRTGSCGGDGSGAGRTVDKQGCV
jgi:hypothetical protein